MISLKNIQNIWKQIERKHLINMEQVKKNPDNNYYNLFVSSPHYFDAIVHEVHEAKKEDKLKNSVYLEDELWDILWDYLCLLYYLEKEWKISSENVMHRCLKKYAQRTDGIEKWIPWDDVKHRQKQELLQEHNETYNIWT